MSDWLPSPDWIQEQADRSRAWIRATPRELLSPAGKMLREMLDREDAAEPLQENVIAFRRR